MSIQRTNDDLPAPQKLLTGQSVERSQPGRFGQNYQTSRLPRVQQDESRPFGQQQVTNGNRFNEKQESSTEQNRPYSIEMEILSIEVKMFFNLDRTDEQQTNQRNGYTNDRGGDFAERGSNLYLCEMII
jgi:hypothetical protein